jgi:hypothetical protein
MKVLAANVYAGNPNIEAACEVIEDIRPGVAALCEVRKFTEPLKDIAGMDLYQNREDSYAANVAGLLRRDMTYEGHGFHRLTDRIPDKPVRIGGPRWTMNIDFSTPSGVKWSMFSVHCPLVSSKRVPSTATPNGEAFVDYMRGLYALGEAKVAAGRRVILAGDFQDYPRQANWWTHTPTKTLPIMGYAFDRHSRDYIAGRGTSPRGDLELVPRARTHADHDWLVRRLV